MRRLTLALVLLLVVATPAFGDDVTKKHQVDSKITTLQDRLAAQKQQEQSLRNEVDQYTVRIRSLEGRVGDVSLRLQTLEADLSLHQRRLNALSALFSIQTKRFGFLEEQYRESISTLNRRLVDIYESDPASTLDVFLGARNIQDAVDQVQYLNDIGAQDRRIAREVATAKAQVKAARAKTKRLRVNVRGETAVISARTGAGRSRRDRRAAGRLGRHRRKDPRRAGPTRCKWGHLDTVGGRPRLAGERPYYEPVWLALGPHASGHRHRRIERHSDSCSRGRDGDLLRLGRGVRQLRRDRPRWQPRDGVWASERDRRRLRTNRLTGAGDRLRRLYRPLHRAAPAFRGAHRRQSRRSDGVSVDEGGA
jgi:TolA-binding protein